VYLQLLDRCGLLQREGHLAVFKRCRSVMIDKDQVLEVRQPVEDLANLGGMLLLGDDG